MSWTSQFCVVGNHGNCKTTYAAAGVNPARDCSCACHPRHWVATWTDSDGDTCSAFGWETEADAHLHMQYVDDCADQNVRSYVGDFPW